ncbi:MAG TPA: hypothetical protein GXX14_11925 [Clostridiaceae bacterium]|nr:hypothetical protein [Clostridiaceae bacterium]
MKKLMILCIVVALLLCSCSRKNESSNVDNITENGSEVTLPSDKAGTEENPDETGNAAEDTKTEETKENMEENEKGDVIKSLEDDLNKDGENEIIEIIQVTSKGENGEGTEEVEGKIRIKDKSNVREKTFVKKAQGFTGLMRDMSISDLDGDGYKDIFIIIPETGNTFSLSYFYIYSYKLDKSYLFNTDNKLAEFCKGFKFTYKGRGMLNIENDTYGFKVTVNLAETGIFPISDDEAGIQYNNSWVEPMPTEIGPSSKLTLVDTGDGAEIAVPLPVFGASVSNVIGEVDLFYSVNKDFEPVMKRFEIHLLDMGKKVKVGEWIIKQ